MPLTRRIKSFNSRYPYIGPVFWMLSIQYYLVQLAVANAWIVVPYSWLKNTISDLGNTVCGPYAGRFVCSPQHEHMNVSFVVLGITMIVGSTLVYHEFRRSTETAIGFSFMALAGFGTALVGLFPENSAHALHALGASLPFLIGNMGLVILGLVLDMPRSLRIYTVVSGVISLAAFSLFFIHAYPGIGQGGMERVAAYPQTIWLIVFGIYISRSHYRHERKSVVKV